MACQPPPSLHTANAVAVLAAQTPPTAKKVADTPVARLLENAKKQTTQTRFYDPAYVSLAYPNGDVSLERGVCTDVVIRALRASGVDLQKTVHEDMRRNFRAYPRKWGLKRPDSNIDHRRVPNLQTYFKRHGKSLPVTDRAADYRPGDIVSWKLPNGLDHIGVVSDALVPGQSRNAIIHNIGRGTEEEDVLFAWKITGHYRYFDR
ncbi:MAG: DUF1287 domain-containing protein [Akkermansiaceae bacterium]|nr:DUF1287 domain-containing protein [Armatimonadota bacterium]